MNIYLSSNQKKKKKQVLDSLPIKLIKVEIGACMASATPPLGPLLGQYGINIVDFCKEFNEESAIFEKETIIPVNIYLGLNKQYYFEFKSLSVSYLIRKIIESKQLKNMDIKKKDFLKICYNIYLFKTYCYRSNLEFKIPKIFSRCLIINIIGTFKSFGYKVVD